MRAPFRHQHTRNRPCKVPRTVPRRWLLRPRPAPHNARVPAIRGGTPRPLARGPQRPPRPRQTGPPPRHSGRGRCAGAGAAGTAAFPTGLPGWAALPPGSPPRSRSRSGPGPGRAALAPAHLPCPASTPSPELRARPASARLRQGYEVHREEDERATVEEREDEHHRLHPPPPPPPLLPSNRLRRPARPPAPDRPSPGLVGRVVRAPRRGLPGVVVRPRPTRPP